MAYQYHRKCWRIFSMTEEKMTKYQLGFDEFYFRKILELCFDYEKEYRHVGLHPDVPKKLGNMFITIYHFARNCPDFPEHIRNPPLLDWNMYGRVRRPLVIYPASGMQYVMSVANEILRQQGEKKVKYEDMKNKFGDILDE